MAEQMQTVILTLKDGRELYYAGKAQIQEGEQFHVVSITFTIPEDLPANYRFEPLTSIRT